MSKSKEQSKFAWSTVSYIAGITAIINGLGGFSVNGSKIEYLWFMLGAGVFLLILPSAIKAFRK